MATAISEQKETKGLTIRDRLKSPAMIAELGKAMPSHCKPDRMARVALTAMTKTPKLAECTEASFFQCLLNLSQWGLEPDGRRAYLIPYGRECTLIISYMGLVELAYRSGVVEAIHADVVRDGDIFFYSCGQVREHVPHFLRRDDNKPVEAGKVFAVYCTVRMKGGAEKTEVMSLADVEGIRGRSASAKKGPWMTDWNEMAKKTVFRRVSKWLPLSAEIVDAMDGDDDKIIDAPSRPAQTIDSLTALIAGPAEETKGEQHDDTQSDSQLKPVDMPAYEAALKAEASMIKCKELCEATFGPDAMFEFTKEQMTRAYELCEARVQEIKNKPNDR